jgi:iron uptake system component EfeO
MKRELPTMTHNPIGSIRVLAATAGAALSLSACGGGSSGGDQQTQVASAMQQSLKGDLTALYQAAIALQAAAPTPTGRGWDATADASAIAAMKVAWISARAAYEHVEGATAPIFPDIDIEIDERYDGFLAEITPPGSGDSDLFDDQGVTGMHAVERILYSDVTPASVIAFEMTLPGYKAAAFPATEAEAAEMKAKLLGRLVTDTKSLLDQWTSDAHLDVSGAFMGLISLMNEQQEKVNNAASGAEESRYSQRTMADLRDNLTGTTTIYGLFSAWLKSKAAVDGGASGADIDAAIKTGFGNLSALYGTISGDALPMPPATWSAENPSAADLQTPFGQLYEAVHMAVDPKQPGSVVDEMNQGAALLGIPGFEGE